MAGGTGGHVFPALAVAAGAAKSEVGWSTGWVPHRGLESTNCARPSVLRCTRYPYSGLRGKGFIVPNTRTVLRLLSSLFTALWDCCAIL